MKTTSAQLTNLRRFRDIARVLAKDDMAIFTDVYLTMSNHKLAYVVDASEIFSYVFLDRLSYLPKEKDTHFALGVSFNDMVLHELLLSGRFAFFMLPSHRLELRQLIESIHERELSELGKLFLTFENKPTLSDSLLSAISEYQNNISANQQLHPQLISRIVDEAFLNAPNILLLARASAARPRERLKLLLSKMNLGPLNTVAHTLADSIKINPNIVSQAYDVFSQLRPAARPASNRVDAYAIAYLYALISQAPSNTSYRFVSRSRTFEDACRALVQNDVISADVLDSIRHPRAFSAYVLARSTERSVSDFVKMRLNSAKAFLDAFDEDTFPHIEISKRIGEESIDKLVYDIERVAIVSSIADADDTVRDRPVMSFYTNLSQLIALLRNQADIRSLIHARAQEIVDRLSSNTVALASSFAIASLKGGSVNEKLEADISAHSLQLRGKRPTELKISVFGLPLISYSLEFYSSFVSDRLAKGITPYMVLSQFISSGESHNSFERRLATAYLLGINDEWDLSFRFVSSSLDISLNVDDTPRHEGLYFRAVTRRRSCDWTKENITASLYDVRLAIESWQAAFGSELAIDSRYLNESAILIDQGIRAGIDVAPLTSLIETPVELWQKVIDQADNETYKLNALNNITYYYTCNNDKLNSEVWLKKLVDYLTKHESVYRELPPSVMDTILRAKLLTNFYTTMDDIAAAELELRELQADLYVRKRPLDSNSL